MTPAPPSPPIPLVAADDVRGGDGTSMTPTPKRRVPSAVLLGIEADHQTQPRRYQITLRSMLAVLFWCGVLFASWQVMFWDPTSDNPAGDIYEARGLVPVLVVTFSVVPIAGAIGALFGHTLIWGWRGLGWWICIAVPLVLFWPILRVFELLVVGYILLSALMLLVTYMKRWSPPPYD